MAKSVPFQVFSDLEDGKIRHLRFDINALADLEDLTQQPVTSILSREKFSISAMRSILWAGLKWEDRTLSPSSIGSLLQRAVEDYGIEAVSLQIATAVSAAVDGSGVFPKKKSPKVPEKKNEEKDMTPSPTGSPTPSVPPTE